MAMPYRAPYTFSKHTHTHNFFSGRKATYQNLEINVTKCIYKAREMEMAFTVDRSLVGSPHLAHVAWLPHRH